MKVTNCITKCTFSTKKNTFAVMYSELEIIYFIKSNSMYEF